MVWGFPFHSMFWIIMNFLDKSFLSEEAREAGLGSNAIKEKTRKWRLAKIKAGMKQTTS